MAAFRLGLEERGLSYAVGISTTSTAQPEPAQPHTPLPTLVRTAKLRWRIEHDYREMKQALGLTHFDGRTWRGWHHHFTLVSVAHAFCTLQRITRSPKETASARASTRSPANRSYSSRSGPAFAPPVTATCQNRYPPDQALLG
ncbi:transposase [Streptomyces sp. NPDC007206]|uniref:transposase n=1 Tax=Streptomyces sp. NPDC007206 TaxID=3154317 RepID=UPI0033EA6AC9